MTCVIGFTDDQGRKRFGLTHDKSSSFATAAEAQTAARDHNRQRGRAAMPTSKPEARRSTSKAALTPRLTATDVEAARIAGIVAERDRARAVFDSPHSRGRERGCVALLTSTKGWSAAEIITELPNLPTDAELASNSPTSSQRMSSVEVDATWSKARGILAAQSKATGRRLPSDAAPAPANQAEATSDRARAAAQNGGSR